MDSVTDWTVQFCNIAVDATQKVEGAYSIKQTSNAGTTSELKYTKTVDWSRFSEVSFYVYHPGWTNEKLWIHLFTGGVDASWWEEDFAASWTEVVIDLSSPTGGTAGAGVDLSNITEIRLSERGLEDPGEDYYWDFIRARNDVESKIANCYIWSPMYKNVAGSRSIRPLGWDINVPYTNWDKRFQLCRIRIKPTYESYFVEGDIIEIQDDNSVCAFYGRIVKKFDRTTSYIIDAWSWGDELMESIFKNAYSAKRTDEILIGQIDASSKSTQSSSIDQTTITYDYDVKIPTYALIDLARYLERGVFYRVPGYNGKSYFDKDITDVNLLPLATLIFPATYDFRDDTVGSEPAGWANSDDGTTTTQIIASLGDHKKVVELVDNDVNGRTYMSDSITSIAIITVEFWYRANSLKLFTLGVYDGTNYNWFRLDNVVGVIVNTWHHFKYLINTTTDKYSSWLDGDLIDDDVALTTASGNITSIVFASNTAQTGYTTYLDAIGYSCDTNYTVGQNLAQFSESHYCKGVRFIGKKSYNLGVTRAHVWGTVNSKEQVNKISSLTTEEQEKGSFPIFPYIDLSLTNYTEVNQLATALKNIFSTDTLFINWRVRGIGFLQWGYGIRARWNIKSSLPTTDNYMITEYIYDAKNDRYLRLILSNNTVFEREFVNIQKQLGRDIVVNASMMDSQASESTADGTVLRQRVLPLLIARAPITHIVAGVPDVNYDSADGVEVGDLYIDTTGVRAFICLSNTAGAADWNQID